VRAVGVITTFILLVGQGCATGESSAGSDGGVGPGVDGSITDGSIGDVVGNKDVGVDAPHGPQLNPNWPPFGLTWTSTGDLGRTGGLTWTYTGIQRTGLTHIYWIICDDPTMPCGLSLDGPISASSQWAFDATDSDLLSGKIIFTNMTSILLEDGGNPPLSGRLTVTIVDSGNAPIPFATVAMLGVTARSGQYGAEIKGTGFTVQALVEVEDMTTSTWTPYLDYYDAQHTPGDAGLMDAGGNAYISYGGSFYDE
jgi:hypothetical protein